MTEFENQDQAELSLQEALNRMKAETPEMPESFRTGWRQAIRKEAEMEAEQTGKKKSARKKSNPWYRGFSIVAAAALILGGTLLGQDAMRMKQISQMNITPGVKVQSLDQGVLLMTKQAEEETIAEATAILISTESAAKYAMDSDSLMAAESMEEDISVENEESAIGETFIETSIDNSAEASALAGTSAILEETIVTSAAMDQMPEDKPHEEETQVNDATAEQEQDAPETIRPMKTAGIGFILLSVVMAALAYTYRRKK